jgi:hypothetical protein
VYAIALTVGLFALVAWIAMSAVAGSVEGWERFDPRSVVGDRARLVIAGSIGLGMGGLSASYAGWNSGLAAVAAIVGAGGLVAASFLLGAPHRP